MVSHIFDKLMQAARCGDWTSVERLTGLVMEQSVPSLADGMLEYLAALKEVLVVTKAARADLAMSANRIHAVAGFQAGSCEPAPSAIGKVGEIWQNPGTPAES